jgi:hypothetical protein
MVCVDVDHDFFPYETLFEEITEWGSYFHGSPYRNPIVERSFVVT